MYKVSLNHKQASDFTANIMLRNNQSRGSHNYEVYKKGPLL